jgi:hypothetical protein
MIDSGCFPMLPQRVGLKNTIGEAVHELELNRTGGHLRFANVRPGVPLRTQAVNVFVPLPQISFHDNSRRNASALAIHPVRHITHFHGSIA